MGHGVASGKTEQPSVTWDTWRFALATCGLSIGASYFLSFCLPALLGLHQWFMSQDVWTTTNSAQFIANGGFGYVYSSNPYFAALPGFLALYAPIVALGDHLKLLTGYPFPLVKPSMWLLSGPFFFVSGSTALLGTDYLAATLGISRRRRRFLLVALAALVVAPTAGPIGHPEDLLALALACISVALLLQGRLRGAALVLSVAILMQTWAVLIVPALVAAAPAGARMKAALRAVAAPAAVGAALFAIDFKDAFLDLVKQPMSGVGQHLPWWSIAAHVKIPVAGAMVSVAAGSGSRSLAVACALGLAWLVRRRPGTTTVMVAVSGALYARGLFEVEYWPYYLAPACVMLALLVASTGRDKPKRLCVGYIGAGLLYLSAPLSYFQVTYAPWLALVILVASGGLSIAAALLPVGPAAGRRAGRTGSARRSAATAAPEPALAS